MDGEGTAPGKTMTRRTLVGAAAAAGLAITATGPVAFVEASARSRRRIRLRRVPFAVHGTFEHGVASGMPTQRGISLWTRVEGLERSSYFGLEIARDPDFRRVVLRQRVFASHVRDYCSNTRLLTSRLRPDTPYWYRFHTREAGSMVGRFKTAKPPDSREPVRIAVWSCQNYESGFYNAHAGIADEPDLDLVICLGDYIYERGGSDGVREDRVGENREAQTLPEYRLKYQLYRSDPNLQAMHAAHPHISVWDDHEVENNWAGEERTPTNGTRAPRMDFLTRRRNAFNAFFEWMPQPRIRSDRDRIYRTLRLGGNAQLFLLDTRSYRDVQPCDDEPGAPCPEAREPGRTILGGPQKEWLLAGLERSRATWKVIGTQVMFMAVDAPSGNHVNQDQWDGYAAERTEVATAIRDRGIRDVSFVTGDIHTFFAGDVTPSGRQDASRSQPTVATELVCGSISSLGLPELFGVDELPAELGPLAGDEGVKANNPHIRYSDTKHRGYGLIELRPDELRCEMRGPETALRPGVPVRTLGRMRVASGTPNVEVQG